MQAQRGQLPCPALAACVLTGDDSWVPKRAPLCVPPSPAPAAAAGLALLLSRLPFGCSQVPDALQVPRGRPPVLMHGRHSWEAVGTRCHPSTWVRSSAPAGSRGTANRTLVGEGASSGVDREQWSGARPGDTQQHSRLLRPSLLVLSLKPCWEAAAPCRVSSLPLQAHHDVLPSASGVVEEEPGSLFPTIHLVQQRGKSPGVGRGDARQASSWELRTASGREGPGVWAEGHHLNLNS